MADDNSGQPCPPAPKCKPCEPGLPGWMATFSDLVTLLLTFFVLLLSFAKTETAKYEAALGSIRNAFGGNVLKHGEVIQRGKSPDDSPTMLDAEDPARPFPIDFLTMEGILDKHEINRESSETLMFMKGDLKEFGLTDSVDVYETPEGIKVRVKDKFYFEEGSVRIKDMTVEVFTKMINLLKGRSWTVFVEGHASRGEVSKDRKRDALMLSADRASAVTRALVERGVRPDYITTVFYGDTRPDLGYATQTTSDPNRDRRVEFTIRKTDLRTEGHKVDPYR